MSTDRQLTEEERGALEKAMAWNPLHEFGSIVSPHERKLVEQGFHAALELLSGHVVPVSSEPPREGLVVERIYDIAQELRLQPEQALEAIIEMIDRSSARPAVETSGELPDDRSVIELIGYQMTDDQKREAIEFFSQFAVSTKPSDWMQEEYEAAWHELELEPAARIKSLAYYIKMLRRRLREMDAASTVPDEAAGVREMEKLIGPRPTSGDRLAEYLHFERIWNAGLRFGAASRVPDEAAQESVARFLFKYFYLRSFELVDYPQRGQVAALPILFLGEE